MVATEATKLANFIGELSDFVLDGDTRSTYQHMGALITDAVLQTGLNYRRVVEPRVRSILNGYPEAETASGFLSIIAFHGLKNILRWQHPEKPRRVLEMTWFFCNESIETENDLREWILLPGNAHLLRGLRGVGPKTVDYIKMLVGISAIPVDRHVRVFVKEAGVSVNGYLEVREVVEQAAEYLRVDKAILDKAIWMFMSSRSEVAGLSR